MRLRARTGDLQLPLLAHDPHEGHRDESQRQAQHVAGGAPCPAHAPAAMDEAEANEHGTRDAPKALAALEGSRRADGAGGRLLAGDRGPGVPGGENGGQHASPPRLNESSDDEGYHEQPRESLNPAVPYQALLPDDLAANRRRALETHKRCVRRRGPEDAMSSRMPTTLRRIALTALVVASACGGGDFVAPTVAASDTYTLHSFNGGALPATLSADASSKVVLLDDTFIFNDGGTYVERGHLQTTRDGVITMQTLESPGTFTREGAQVTLVSTSGTITGSFTGDSTLTIIAGFNTLVFRR